MGVGAARYTLAEKQARDSQRKSDLNQYRIALENYSAANNTAYPIKCGNVSDDSSGLCSFAVGESTFQTTYLSGSCLQDPRTSESVFYYYCGDGSQYAVWASLESGGYYEVCSNGKSGKLATQPDAAGGNCSL